jgi:hypothetical protein
MPVCVYESKSKMIEHTMIDDPQRVVGLFEQLLAAVGRDDERNALSEIALVAGIALLHALGHRHVGRLALVVGLGQGLGDHEVSDVDAASEKLAERVVDYAERLFRLVLQYEFVEKSLHGPNDHLAVVSPGDLDALDVDVRFSGRAGRQSRQVALLVRHDDVLHHLFRLQHDRLRKRSCDGIADLDEDFERLLLVFASLEVDENRIGICAICETVIRRKRTNLRK